MAVSASLADFGLMLGTCTSMRAGDVGLFLRLGLYAFLLLRTLQFRALESDAAHDGLCDFFVTYVAFYHCD